MTKNTIYVLVYSFILSYLFEPRLLDFFFFFYNVIIGVKPITIGNYLCSSKSLDSISLFLLPPFIGAKCRFWEIAILKRTNSNYQNS